MSALTRRDFSHAVVGTVGLGVAGSLRDLPDITGEAEPPLGTGTITDVPGIQEGHYTDTRRPTGCTVLLCGQEGAAKGVDYDRSAPGIYQVVRLQPVSFSEEVRGNVFSGGSSLGV